MACSRIAAGLRRLLVTGRAPPPPPHLLSASVFPSFSSTRSFSKWSCVDERNKDDDYEDDYFFCPYDDRVFRPRNKHLKEEGENAIDMGFDLPGLGEDDVRVSFTNYTRLTVEARRGKHAKKGRSAKIYMTDLKADHYDCDQIKTHMKNGHLRILLPKKLKEEEVKKIDNEQNKDNNHSNDDDNALIARGDPNHVGILESGIVSAPSLFSEVFDNLFPRRVKGKENHWKAEDEDGLYLSTNMPGLGKEDVEVSLEVEHKVLTVREVETGGNNKENNDAEESDDDGQSETRPKSYKRCFKLPAAGIYNKDQVIAEMKNGMLRVFIPKLNVEKIGVQVKGE